MSITLEFWKDKVDGTLNVQYNLRNMAMREFLALPETGRIIEAMYQEIRSRWPKCDKGDVLRTVGTFIHDHLLETVNPFDVVIMEETMKVTINIEKP